MRTTSLVLRLLATLVLVLSVLVVGCKKSTASAEPPVLPEVTTQSQNLLLTWIDEKGDFHVEQSVANVPANARETVRVVDPSSEPSPDTVFVADLRESDTRGVFPVRTMRRAEFEKIATDRRAKGGVVLEDKPAATTQPAMHAPVVIYGASWCGPCHQAAAYLKQRGVAFVERDIESDSSAAREMQAKLAKANMRSGSIPVIDVRGTLVVGFDVGTLDKALGVR